MYARGLSTRDVEDLFRDATGELLISRTAVSEITDRLWDDYVAFSRRDLFLDAVYESLRRYGAKEGVLAAWCITAQGTKVLLHLAVGNKESEKCWTDCPPSMGSAAGKRQALSRVVRSQGTLQTVSHRRNDQSEEHCRL